MSKQELRFIKIYTAEQKAIKIPTRGNWLTRLLAIWFN
jgi:hypothetical protein